MPTNPALAEAENAEVLRRMAENGIDLASPRDVDFEHSFPDETSARAFQAAVAKSVFEVTRIAIDPESDGAWQVQCRARMVPTASSITLTELSLARVAQAFGGSPDGWGCLSNPDGSPAD